MDTIRSTAIEQRTLPANPILVLLGLVPRAPDLLLEPDAAPLVVGRTPPVGGLQLVDGRISGRHARIDWCPDPPGFVIDDLQSSNGTWLDGQRVAQAALRAPGVLRLGDTVWLLTTCDALAPARLPPPLNQVNRAQLPVVEGHFVVGPSRRTSRLQEQIAAAAASPLNLLLLGETGVGKEVVARAVHEQSPRAAQPLLSVNCVEIPESLLENELFGHEARVITGAPGQQRGLFEQAHRSTLLLDEIGELGPALQAKLLRVLQFKQIRRIGSERAVAVDVRIITATSRPLTRLVEQDLFRKDLFFRMDQLRIEIPPLRERREDLPALLRHLLQTRAPGLELAGEVVEALAAHGWPGNIRELEATVERMALWPAQRGRGELERLHQPACLPADPSGPVSDLSHLADGLAGGVVPRVLLPPRASRSGAPSPAVWQQILDAMVRTGGEVTSAARLLGVSRKTLDRHFRDAGVAAEEIRRWLRFPHTPPPGPRGSG